MAVLTATTTTRSEGRCTFSSELGLECSRRRHEAGAHWLTGASVAEFGYRDLVRQGFWRAEIEALASRLGCTEDCGDYGSHDEPHGYGI